MSGTLHFISNVSQTNKPIKFYVISYHLLDSLIPIDFDTLPKYSASLPDLVYSTCYMKHKLCSKYYLWLPKMHILMFTSRSNKLVHSLILRQERYQTSANISDRIKKLYLRYQKSLKSLYRT